MPPPLGRSWLRPPLGRGLILLLKFTVTLHTKRPAAIWYNFNQPTTCRFLTQSLFSPHSAQLEPSFGMSQNNYPTHNTDFHARSPRSNTFVGTPCRLFVLQRSTKVTWSKFAWQIMTCTQWSCIAKIALNDSCGSFLTFPSPINFIS